MRPIDYAIKMIAAYNMSRDYFTTLTESLYDEDSEFISAVINCLEEHDQEAKNAAENIFHQLDECQL